MPEVKDEYDELGFSELMKQPKPELCDYIMRLRCVIDLLTPVVREPAPRHMDAIAPQRREYEMPDQRYAFPQSVSNATDNRQIATERVTQKPGRKKRLK